MIGNFWKKSNFMLLEQTLPNKINKYYLNTAMKYDTIEFNETVNKIQTLPYSASVKRQALHGVLANSSNLSRLQ